MPGSGLIQRLRALFTHQGGGVVILFALTLPILVFIVGISIDYGRASKARTVAATVLDAALLTAGRELSIGGITEGDVQSRVSELFNAMIAEANVTGSSMSVDTTVNQAAGTISGSVSGHTTAAFGGIIGTPTLEIGTVATVSYNTLTVELSLVLDVTGSMRGQKIADLKEAAKNLINILIPENGSANDKVRIALVPYSNSVNVDTFAEMVTGNAGTRCVTERPQSNAFKDTPPSTALFPTTGTCPTAVIEPLSDNRAELIASIDSYSANGWTAGHIGAAWGWYMLSPDWAPVWPGRSDPEPYSKPDHIKVMVLMTDGQFNTWYQSGIGNSSRQARRVCRNAKRDGVIIYSVAFRAPGSAKNTLRRCATTQADHYFETSTGNALKNAFEAIANEIRNLRLSV